MTLVGLTEFAVDLLSPQARLAEGSHWSCDALLAAARGGEENWPTRGRRGRSDDYPFSPQEELAGEEQQRGWSRKVQTQEGTAINGSGFKDPSTETSRRPPHYWRRRSNWLPHLSGICLAAGFPATCIAAYAGGDMLRMAVACCRTRLGEPLYVWLGFEWLRHRLGGCWGS
jgi:hypothetical protein